MAFQQAATPPPAASSLAPAPGLADQLIAAEHLVQDGRTDEARAILLRLEAGKPAANAQINQIEFLLGLIAIADKDYDDAILRFHRILVTEPKVARVRLELARAYYLNNEFANSEREFLLARAGALPPNVVANIDRYLASIRALRTFTYNLSFSVATDSNANGGPATDSITLYGLPFQLSQLAKQSSGYGLAFDGGLEWAPRIGRQLKWRLGGQLHRSQYTQTAFDDMTFNVYTGPHLTLRRWDIDLAANVARRWYGERTYWDLVGAGAGATYYLRSNLGVGAAFTLNHLRFPQSDLQTGSGGAVSANAFFTPTTSSIVRAALTLGVQNARIPAYASHLQQLGLSYTREFKGGLTVGIAPTYSHIAYQGRLAAFDATRLDNQVSVQITLLDRRIDWNGFTPEIVYTYIHNDSTLPLYRFHRNLGQIGITRAF
ncbi:MAG TPA: surface lipoprotein assembly modifier [Caulobacteraceae bacterium]|jgi:hypothetical protein